MRRGLVGFGLVLCALPAHGADPPDALDHALSPIDELPNKEDLIQLVGPTPIVQLRDRALDDEEDFGVRLRAIRAIPEFCVPHCATPITEPAHPARAALFDVFAKVVGEPPDLANLKSGRDVLYLRAAIESLGITRSNLEEDVDRLQLFLTSDTQSIDLRAAAAHALGRMCLPSALSSIEARLLEEPNRQVREALSSARSELMACLSR